MRTAAPVSLKSRALRMLARREHTRQELAMRLREFDEQGELEALLDRLVETGLQSDARFAESYVRSRAGREGVLRLRNELAKRGVAPELIAQALDQMLAEDGQDETARAREVWKKKFGVVPPDAREWARQARFLQSRGFSAEVIRKLLKEPFDESA